ncbi:MAG: hypothetical protein JKY67_21160 [Pseudomonadales bacterium]|nr:hypothetical protein [Pseudomonadales bacterium]
MDKAAIDSGESLKNETAIEVKNFITATMASFPWRIDVTDWMGNHYFLGQGQQHWRGTTMKLTLKTERVGRLLLGMRAMKFLDAYVEGEVDIDGNVYLASEIRNYAKLDMTKWEIFSQSFSNLTFQNVSRAKANVKSHYDIPQRSIEYLSR